MTRSLLALVLGLSAPLAGADGFMTGRPDIRSLSALAFGPEGVLFVGEQPLAESPMKAIR